MSAENTVYLTVVQGAPQTCLARHECIMAVLSNFVADAALFGCLDILTAVYGDTWKTLVYPQTVEQQDLHVLVN